MEVIVTPTPGKVSDLAARIVVHQIRQAERFVLGCATGATMEGLYLRLAQADLDWSGVVTFNLDEYLGLPPEHPSSYAHYMKRHLFEPLGLPEIQTHLLDGTTEQVSQHCRDYETAIAARGGIDLQLLGIGRDGHIAFNEPGSSLASRTRLKTLTPLTRESNARHFPPGSEVPRYVLTMGIGTIMEARHLLLLAHGESKAEAVASAVEGPLAAVCPASVLQLHPKATVLLDEAAASRLKRLDYYRMVYEHKPPWLRAALEGEPSAEQSRDRAGSPEPSRT